MLHSFHVGDVTIFLFVDSYGYIPYCRYSVDHGRITRRVRSKVYLRRYDRGKARVSRTECTYPFPPSIAICIFSRWTINTYSHDHIRGASLHCRTFIYRFCLHMAETTVGFWGDDGRGLEHSAGVVRLQGLPLSGIPSHRSAAAGYRFAAAGLEDRSSYLHLCTRFSRCPLRPRRTGFHRGFVRACRIRWKMTLDGNQINHDITSQP